MTQPLRTLIELLEHRAEVSGDARAFVTLPERGRESASATFAELRTRALSFAARLAERGRPGDRALVFYDTGVDFLVVYFGCVYAGVIPVPVVAPRKGKPLRRFVTSIAADCTPRFAIAPPDIVDGARVQLAAAVPASEILWLSLESTAAAHGFLPHRARPEDIAHMQYTSGSTSAPKGVMVTHANVLDNAEMIRRIHANDETATHACWLPLYHDMGLVLNVLECVYVGALCVLIPPIQFIYRPLLWLWAISDYRARVGGGPNFGFDLCLERAARENLDGMDLSSWEVAINGAEPVRADTLRRFAATFGPHGFRETAPNPCYGMAESTLLISGCPRGRLPVIERVSRSALMQHRVIAGAPGDELEAVSCGHVLDGESLAVVDPDSLARRPDGAVGELWVAGPHVASGYWKNEAATAATFAARTADGGGPFLRTGDLGFVKCGELFVTGRLKDMMIVRGNNHYPQDIELTSESSHPGLRRNFAAVFVSGVGDGARVTVVQEIDREHEATIDREAAMMAIREATLVEHGVAIASVVLIKHGTLPKTSSGKVQRTEALRQYTHGELEVLARSELALPGLDLRATS